MTTDQTNKQLGLRLATNVKNYRIAKGYTQLDLAAKIDVSRRFIVYIESGERMPKANVAYRIAKALDVTLDSLFESEG